MLFSSIALIYLVIKGAFFASLLKAFVASEGSGRRAFFFAMLYTLGVAGLAFVYFGWIGQQQGGINFRVWMPSTFVLAWLYFGLLSRFEDAGLLWWIILIAGVGLVWW